MEAPRERGSGSEAEEAIGEYARLLEEDQAPDPDSFLAGRPGIADRIRDRILHLRAAHDALAGFVADAPPVDSLPTAPVPASPVLPAGVTRLGDFRVVREIGKGGMGVVYEAVQESLGRLVALKVLRPESAGSPASTARFVREAQAVARLRHPNVVTVFATGEEAGVRYLAMELVPGRGLDEVLREATGGDGEVPVAQAIRWIASIARALESAHAQGIVHRDVKPSNIRITPEGKPLLLDFGLAREEGGATVTLTGEFRGTPQYASPEQVDPGGSGIDARTDVYSLGVTLYECVTGTAPFVGETTVQLFARILGGTPPSPRRRNSSISRDLETVILTAMEKERERRYATAGAFADDLEALLEIRPIRARPAGAVTRSIRWARRHRGATGTIGVSLAAGMAIAGIFLAQGRADARSFRREVAAGDASFAHGDHENAIAAYDRALGRRPDDAATLRRREEVVAERGRALARLAVEEARAALDEYRRLRSSLDPLRERIEGAAERFEASYLPPEEREAFFEDQDELASASRRMGDLYLTVLETLNRASRHDPESRSLSAAYAEAYLEKWREAVGSGNEAEEVLFRERVLQHDLEGRWRAELEGTGTISVLGSPEGAEVHLFRYELQSRIVSDGERRLVPVPFDPVGIAGGSSSRADGAADFRPGEIVLRVDAVDPGSPGEAAGIRPRDLVLRLMSLPVDESIFVAIVDPAGKAAKSGVRPFDRLARIAGREIRTMEAPNNAYAGVARGERCEAVFERLGAETRIEVVKGERTFAEELGVQCGQAPAALRVARGADGTALTVLAGEGAREVVLAGEVPSGLRGDLTAYPLRCSSANLLGRIPLEAFSAPPGSYLLVLNREGYEELRVPFLLDRGTTVEIRAEMLPLGASPRGFAWIPPGPFLAGGDPEAPGSWPRGTREVAGFWIQRREVLVQEYLEFLNDPAVLEEIRAAEEQGESIRVPQTSGAGGRWVRRDGRFQPPTDPRLPLTGVTWEDAAAFSRWRTERGSARGEKWIYELPTEEEWEKAARGADGRRFPWGDAFDWGFCNGGWTGPRMWLALAALFPRDASPWEVKDMAGSVAEWCRGEGSTQPIRGGSWSRGEVRAFRCAQRTLSHRGAVSYQAGFRLVARPR